VLSYAPTNAGRGTRIELALTYAIALGTGAVLLWVSDAIPARGAEISDWSLAAIVLMPMIGATTRRLHDANQRARRYVSLLAPWVGIFIVGYYLLRPGYDGANEFGVPPRDRI
jgi:uncharacterized membrane protein YhaH (DUF805 family)